ncbi:MAG TPA: carboxypeptidase-like regulatory domain-containing protein [Thermoanaerobaculia bacterium]|nr:carboxypeptidase-like regulatory domain-containing protein [Thermoanaerobaculia bacterium]
MKRRLLAWQGFPLVALFAVALGLAPAASWGAAPYRRGQIIEITGTVVDAAGRPVEGVTVVLLAAHEGFELRRLRRVEKGFVRVPTTTDARGAFRLEWRWSSYYDAFRIRVEGVSAADAASGSRKRSVLTEIDLSRRMLAGSPVVVALEIGGASPPRRDGSLEDARPGAGDNRAGRQNAGSVPRGVDVQGARSTAEPVADATSADTHTDDSHSADQRRIYEEMGKPDRVDRLELSKDAEEVAWWYFERGRSYHFRDGRLEQVVEFDPVKTP